jgi:hypothetical protein
MEEPAKWATAYKKVDRRDVGCRTLRTLGFLGFNNLGFRCAPPQALGFHPLRGFGNVAPCKLIKTSWSL